MAHFDWERLVELSEGKVSEIDFVHIVGFQSWCHDNPDFNNDRDYFIFDQEILKSYLNEYFPQAPKSDDHLEFKEILKKKKNVRFEFGISSSENECDSDSSEDSFKDSSSFDNNTFSALMTEEDKAEEKETDPQYDGVGLLHRKYSETTDEGTKATSTIDKNKSNATYKLVLKGSKVKSEGIKLEDNNNSTKLIKLSSAMKKEEKVEPIAINNNDKEKEEMNDDSSFQSDPSYESDSDDSTSLDSSSESSSSSSSSLYLT